MKVELTVGPVSGRFTAIEDDHELGIMVYHLTDEEMEIDTTEVSPAFEGKGVGKFLVSEAVRFAREKHIKIRPMCWFVKLILNQNPNYSDVLA